MTMINSSLANPIEQKEWVRAQLTKLWGPNNADYYVNSNRTAHQHHHPKDSEKDSQMNSKNASNPSISANQSKKVQRTGLYAYMIWDNIRDESTDRLKIFDLDKELQQTMDKYMKGSGRRRSISSTIDEDFSIFKEPDTTKIKQAKIYRNEIELMFRSSKLNEEKSSIMRANSPLPDLNTSNHNNPTGYDSISKYLPPIVNLNGDQRAYQVNTSFEFIKSPTMRHLYKKKMDEKTVQSAKKKSASYKMIDVKSGRNAENIRLKFLTERPARDYLARNHSNNRNNDINESGSVILDDTEIEDRSPKIDISYNDETEPHRVNLNEQKSNALTNTTTSSFPPLTMNALMEYKPLLKAPGAGEFENGRPKLFKLN